MVRGKSTAQKGSVAREKLASREEFSVQEGLEDAQRYLDESQSLRTCLALPRDAILAAHPLAQGEHNSNFWFAHPESGRKYVLRINYASQLGLSDQVTYEFCALRALASSGRTPEPLYLDATRSIISRGLLVMSFCEGAWLDYAKPHQVEDAAFALADVHSVSVPDSCPLIHPADPLREQYEECRVHFEVYRHSSLADPMVIRYVRDFFATVLPALVQQPDIQSGRIINTEAVASHFLIPNHGSASMVDWEKPIIGEVAQDVAYFLSPTTTIWDTDYLFSDEERAAFIESYWRAVDGRFSRGAFERRFPAFVMMNCLRGITWSARAFVEYHDPSRPLQNEKTRRKLDRYLSEDFLSLVRERFFSQYSSW